MFPQWHLPWINMRAVSVIAAPDVKGNFRKRSLVKHPMYECGLARLSK
jgi:hypothetical protein